MKKYRRFCEEKNIAVGKFAEFLLEEAIEDAHFAEKADTAMRVSLGKPLTSHDKLMAMLGKEEEKLA